MKKYSNKPCLYMLIGALSLPLTSCGGIKDSLGLEKDSPDEFAVITRAPLEMPDTLTLPPPVPGMPRPQEKSTIISAKEAIIGHVNVEENNDVSTIESALLKKAGANSTSSDIRAIIDKETKEINQRNIPVTKKILKLGGGKPKPQAVIVDAKKELERIKKNKEAGKTIIDGKTPYIKE